LILLLVTSILTNQEAVLRRFVATIYEYFMQQEGSLLCFACNRAWGVKNVQSNQPHNKATIFLSALAG
jgi:hypothetical protein